jgi:hypothetical protein
MLLENSQLERLFDSSTQDFFRRTAEPIAPMTELELVRRGAETMKIPLEQQVRSGAIFLASSSKNQTPNSGFPHLLFLLSGAAFQS